MEEMDLKDAKATICRVCMQCVFEELPLFEEHDNCKISVKINALTNVCVREGDGLPDRICPTCLLELESAFKFKLKCENTNKVLQYFNKNLMQTPVKCFDYVGDPIKMENSDDEDGEEAPLLGDVSTQSESFEDVADSNRKEYLDDEDGDEAPLLGDVSTQPDNFDDVDGDEAPLLGDVSTQPDNFDDVADSNRKEYLDDEDVDEPPLLGDVSTQPDNFDNVTDSNKKKYLDDEVVDEMPLLGDVSTQPDTFDNVTDSNRKEYLDNEDGDEAPHLGNVSTQSDSFDDEVDPIKMEYSDDEDDIDDSNKKEYLDNENSDIDVETADEFSQHNGETDTNMQPHVETPAPSKAINLKLECHDCGGSFESKCKLSAHWNKVHLPQHLKCPKCKRQFKQYTLYNLHMKRRCIDTNKVRVEGEGKNRVFHCKECNYQSPRSYAVALHSVLHSGERPYQCDICHKSFTQKVSIFKHKENIHKLYRTVGTCPHCGKYIQGKVKMSDHIRRAHKSVSCEICNKVLKQTNLARHMKRHSSVKGYVCEVCPCTFYTFGELFKHKKRASHLPSQNMQCNIETNRILGTHKLMHADMNTVGLNCGRILDNASQIALHKTEHKDRKYQCAICEERFNLRKSLVTHIKTQHF